MWQSSTLPQKARLPAGATTVPRQEELDRKKVQVENALNVLNTELAKTREMVRRFHSEADRSERYGVEAVILKKAAICSDLGRPAPKAGQHLIELMSERRIPAIAHEAIAERCPAGVRGFDAIQRKVFQQYHRAKKLEAQGAVKKSLPVVSPQEKYQPPANLDLSQLLRQPLPLTTIPEDKDPNSDVPVPPPAGARTGTSGSDVLYGMPRFSPKNGQQPSPDFASLDRLLEPPQPPRLRSPMSRSGVVSLEESLPVPLPLLNGDVADPMLESIRAKGRGSRGRNREDGTGEGLEAVEEDASFDMATTSFYQVTPKSRGQQGESERGSPSRAGTGFDATGTLGKYRKGTPLNGTGLASGTGTGANTSLGLAAGDWRTTSMQRDILVRSIHTVHGNREPAAPTVTLTFSDATVKHLKSIGRLSPEAAGNTFTVCRRPPTGQRPLLAPVPLHALAHVGTKEGDEAAYKPLSDIQRSRIELNFRRTNPEYSWLPPTPSDAQLGRGSATGGELVDLSTFQSSAINPFFSKAPELFDEPASGLSHLRPQKGEGSTDVPQVSIRSYAEGDKLPPPVYLTQSEALMMLQPLGRGQERETDLTQRETVDWDSQGPLPGESIPPQRPPLSGMLPRAGTVDDELSTEADEAAGTYVSKEEEKARELAKADILARRRRLEAEKHDVLKKLSFERFPGVHPRSRNSSRSPSRSPNSRDGSNGRRGSPWRKKEFDPVAAGRALRRDRLMRRRTPPRLLSLAKPVERKTHSSLTTYEEFKEMEAAKKRQAEAEREMSRHVHLPVFLHVKGMV
jgi:hypothetical protein